MSTVSAQGLGPAGPPLRPSRWTRVAPLRDYWTDDRCPVEWMTDRMIITYGVSGQDPVEQLLPMTP